MRNTTLSAIVLASAALASCGGEDAAQQSSPMLSGEALYSLLRCAACHGDSGEGAMTGPIIRNPVHEYATFVLRNGRRDLDYPEPMPIYEPREVTDAELESVLDWLDTLPKPATGPELYAAFCGNCHGDDGSGGRSEKSIVNVADLSASIRAGRGGENYGERTRFMPAWTASELSDSEVELIAGFLRR